MEDASRNKDRESQPEICIDAPPSKWRIDAAGFLSIRPEPNLLEKLATFLSPVWRIDGPKRQNRAFSINDFEHRVTAIWGHHFEAGCDMVIFPGRCLFEPLAIGDFFADLN